MKTYIMCGCVCVCESWCASVFMHVLSAYLLTSRCTITSVCCVCMPCHRIFFSLMCALQSTTKRDNSYSLSRSLNGLAWLQQRQRRQQPRLKEIFSFFFNRFNCSYLCDSLVRPFFSYSCCFIKTFRLYNYYGFGIGVDGQEMRFIMYSIYIHHTLTMCIHFAFDEKANVRTLFYTSSVRCRYLYTTL